jgi:hypothetical protein
MRVDRTALIAGLVMLSVGVLSCLAFQAGSSKRSADDFLGPWKPPHSRLPATIQVPRLEMFGFCERITRQKAGTVSQLLHQIMLPDIPMKSLVELRRGCLQVLTSRDSFGRFFPDAPELVYRGPHMEWEITDSRECRGRGESHPDQLVACLGRAGVSPDCAFETTEGSVTVATLLESSRRLFVLDQELPWSVTAYLSYLPNHSEWENRFGERISYQDIAQRLVTQEFGAGSCAGTHNLFALAYLLRANEQFAFLNSPTERACREHLKEASTILIRTISKNGCWSANWARSNQSDDEEFDLQAINITAHHVEWMCLLEEPLRPSDGDVATAVQFLYSAIRRQTHAAVKADLSGSVHAAVALHPFVMNDMMEKAGSGK